MANEVEIKFRIEDALSLENLLREAGFHLKTARTHEVNTLYDLPDRSLRNKGEVLRLRQYGADWVLTHKSKGKAGKHKIRKETETKVEKGEEMDSILHELGYVPSFRYEKYRAEWADATGHVVVDHTPVGDFGEIEGPAEWIDRTARKLGIGEQSYISQSYIELFEEWKRKTGSSASNMTFAETGK